MTGQVLAFRDPETRDGRETLLDDLVDLHTLITLDPLLGASPVRIYFVVNPHARQRIAECHDARDRSKAGLPPAYALVAYDFPFALHIAQTNAPRISRERATEIVTRSAGLQGDALQAAAGAFDLEAQPVAAFDAGALKTTFFPDTQETVTHLFRIKPR
jgi:hypothetical protein